MYPWPSFGSFTFAATERPSFESDSGWVPSAISARTRALGATTDSFTLLALGSLDRHFTVMLSPARMAELQALVGTTASFTDWDRPTPNSRSAYLESVQQEETILRVGNRAGLTTDQRRNVRVSLSSQ